MESRDMAFLTLAPMLTISWEEAGLVVAQDLIARASALLRAAFHEALEIDRAMLAGEVALVRALPLGAAEKRVLADFPIRVRTQQEKSMRGIVVQIWCM